jgi:hypothetical protein
MAQPQKLHKRSVSYDMAKIDLAEFLRETSLKDPKSNTSTTLFGSGIS